ncbi:MAG: tyrosine--tRNA ligase [Chitinophagales bacterium]|mgnify:CR=1 FL=1|nr:tyrosine--tRNA ligase [Chitinophagales bacterium]
MTQLRYNIVEDLRWRGQIQDMTPGVEEQLNKESTSVYIGFDPTADSLHVGSLAQIVLLKRLQLAGHKPFALVGGATGMVGDPSGKSEERNLLDETILQHNLDCLKKQLAQFLDFEGNAANSAELVNNYEWFKDFNILEFLRDVGKYLTVNYMLSKDSVKNRLERESGISFTEFTYQLIQGYDFYWLYANKGVKVQMGGSDQWGNIVTGTELVGRKTGGKAYAITIPLVMKSDGTKFGKTASGNVWLDARLTSPYQFYQFWLNQTDEDAAKYVRYFTFLPHDVVENLEKQHAEAPHLRLLQKTLAQELTVWVHGQQEYDQAVQASEILFGKANVEMLRQLPEATLLDVMSGVPKYSIPADEWNAGINIVSLLSEKTDILPSKTETRKALQSNSISLNQTKIVDANHLVSSADLLNDKYLLVQKGKKNYYLIGRD